MNVPSPIHPTAEAGWLSTARPYCKFLSNEGGTYRGMMIALPPEDWKDFEP